MISELLRRPYVPPRRSGWGSARADESQVDLLLVCSSGGHLLQLLGIGSVLKDHYSCQWVTFDKSDARSLLANESVVYAYGPTNRSVRNLLRNTRLAWSVVAKCRPRVLITTGAGVAVPFAWIARLRGSKVVYVESFSRITSPSLTYRLVRRATNRTYVQWPDLCPSIPEARFVGSVFGDP
jgi:UDP-N-acetylglucosamine:LPS N-acetylglucosamine transferase